MNVLMIGVDKTSVGGMLTVIENYLNNEYFCEKVHLQYVSTVVRGGKFLKIKTFLKKLPKIKKIIKEKHIDIVHVHMAERGSVFREGYVIHLAKKMGCKTIIHMHGATIEDWYNRQNKIIKKIVKKVFCSPDKMLVLGDLWLPFMKKVIGKENEYKLKVLHNAVNVPKINNYNLEAKEILFYGMLIQRKGIDDLLQAFSEIKNEIPTNIKLVLYGDDYDSEEKINDKIKRYDLENYVEYRGWLTAENREKVFKNIIVNVLPSYNEGLPMTILESMGYGIPNISTNIAAIPEAIFNDVNGYLINPGNIEELKEKMKNIILSKELRQKFSDNAYQVAQEEFSLNSHLNKLINIYQEVLTNSNSINKKD